MTDKLKYYNQFNFKLSNALCIRILRIVNVQKFCQGYSIFFFTLYINKNIVQNVVPHQLVSTEYKLVIAVFELMKCAFYHWYLLLQIHFSNEKGNVIKNCAKLLKSMYFFIFMYVEYCWCIHITTIMVSIENNLLTAVLITRHNWL